MAEHGALESSGKRISPVQMQKHLKGTSYPASKDDLVRQAQTNHASNEMVEQIRALPAESFGGPKDVMKALGRRA
ncbi:MAG TPA: DUF2795 domain-containing protein [Ktedonobacterales bacterium]|nr:DUF2795 domain-containing protein [Ktedonobacterales bacterium]